MNGQMNNQNQQSFVNNMQGQVPMMVKPNKKTIKEIIEELEEKNVIKVVGIIVGALIILGVFLPMVTIKYGNLKESSNLWDSTVIERFIIMVLGILVILSYIFNKLKNFTSITAGVLFMIFLSTFDAWLELSSAQRGYTHLSLAFFVYLLAFIILVVLTIINNIDEVIELFKGKPKEFASTVNVNSMANPVSVNSISQPVVAPQNYMNQQPVNQLQQQPVAQQPVNQYQQPMGQYSQPQMGNVCPNCGAKKIGVEPFCTNCGKQF